VLQYLLFLKEKCDSIIKARECADGRSQREYDKIGQQLPNGITRGHALAMRHGHQRRKILSSNQHTGHIYTSRYVTGCPHATVSMIAKLIIKLPKLYRKYTWKIKHDKPMLKIFYMGLCKQWNLSKICCPVH